MLQYKTRCIPVAALRGVKKKEFNNGLTPETANAAAAEVDYVIQEESRQGWALHSLNRVSKKIIRKKTILELLLGWIPILGGLLFRNLNETIRGIDCEMYILTFVREG